MEVMKVPKKIVTVIEPKRSMTVDKEKYRFADQEYRLELVEILKNDEKVEDRINQTIEKFNNYMANLKDMKDEEKLNNAMALLMEQQTLINAILLNRR